MSSQPTANPDQFVKTLEFRIEGDVQGVGLRSSVRRYAVEHGIDGTVENRPDGSVRIVAQASESRLDALKDWLASAGLSNGMIRRTSVRAVEAAPSFSDFRIVW